MGGKPNVFVITPFEKDFLELYDELKRHFESNFDFVNAGDLDNQQNILKDIVEGIQRANVVIADLTGLNPNVFYELGLAHAMDKKVIIITQDIAELPFDIKSYRAVEYSLKFNKLPAFKDELGKLLQGAMDNSVKFGNPVSDYTLNYCKVVDSSANMILDTCENAESVLEREDERGFLDFIVDIEENSKNMTAEIMIMGEEMTEMNQSIITASIKVDSVKTHSNNIDIGFVRGICRTLSEPIDEFAKKLNGHVKSISKYWDLVENSYLALLDSQYTKNEENTDDIRGSLNALKEMQNEIKGSNGRIEDFVGVLQSCHGIERRLNKAITSLVTELESYLQMTDTMSSSIDRILGKGEVVLGEYLNVCIE